MKKKTKQKLIFSMLSIIAIIVFVFLGASMYLNSLFNNIDRDPVINEQDASISQEIIELHSKTNIVNIALFGADNDGNESDQMRSDAIKILSLDYDKKEIKISSLQRDLVVFIPGDYQKFGHLNWAYWIGKGKLAIQTINYNFDLDITKYATLSFESVEKIVDLVDGVAVELTESEMEILNISGEAGLYTLNGSQALKYSRIRKIDTDYQRMERQQNVIDALVVKISKMNIIELLDFVKEALPYITTNLTNQEIRRYMISLMSFDLSIETHQVPSGGVSDTCACPGLGGVLVDSYTDMVVELHDFIYGEGFYTPSQSFIDNEKAIYHKYGTCE